ncbi:MAG: hypothetical protein ACJAYS_000487 [Lentimonas sp.]|jgi:hypothetical protein
MVFGILATVLALLLVATSVIAVFVALVLGFVIRWLGGNIY